MLQENKIIELLPQVLSGDRLIEELGYLPAYNETIIEQSQANRNGRKHALLEIL